METIREIFELIWAYPLFAGIGAILGLFPIGICLILSCLFG